ncbi:helix-turn-helix transcriptional regulator [Leifsonia williamsii]|uniref:helix-turn-helix transcriptional regulator n=1 Tax=Leifsonia williamsii TaxID=3035919 RepID=UPI00341A8340
MHLTPREAQVLEGICAGRSHAELATYLHISRSTVAQHIESIRRKLGAVNRPAMVARAFFLGVVRPDRWPPALSGRRCVDPGMLLGSSACTCSGNSCGCRVE